MHKRILLSLIASLIIILLSACAQDASTSGTAFAFGAENRNIETATDKGTSSNVEDVSVTEGRTPDESPSEMVIFNGLVFVATTEMDENLWKMAGWRISTQAIDTNNSDVPQDCTLYPHQGVSNQWVGSCTGNILIPRGGAKHIAVMVTEENGSTNMIQVAPQPDTD